MRLNYQKKRILFLVNIVYLYLCVFNIYFYFVQANFFRNVDSLHAENENTRI